MIYLMDELRKWKRRVKKMKKFDVLENILQYRAFKLEISINHLVEKNRKYKIVGRKQETASPYI